MRYSISDLPNILKEEALLFINDDLVRLFLETGTYQRAASNRTPIYYIKGRKGAGKSTLLSKIYHDNAPNAFVVYFKDFFNEINKRVSEISAEQNERQLNLCYEKEWKNELWILIVQHLYYDHRKNRKLPWDMGDYLKLYNFLKRNHLPLDDSFIVDVVDAVGDITTEVGNLTGKIGIKLARPSRNNAENLDREIQQISKIATRLLGKNPLWILFDEIDKVEVWNESVRASILGLSEAVSALVRDVNSAYSSEIKLLVRIAIREDMFRAASVLYVDDQKIPDDLIIITWSKENLKEMVARQIRLHWGLGLQEISCDKLLLEIFPGEVARRQETFEYLITMARRNPRALNALIKSSINQAINRKLAYLPQNKYQPVAVTRDDIATVIVAYSQSQLRFVKNANAFLYKKLPDLVNHFVRHAIGLLDKGRIPYKVLEENLTKLFSSDAEIKSAVNDWPHDAAYEELKAIQVLYDIGIIGTRKGRNDSYTPDPYIKSNFLVIHPTYRPAILGLVYPNIKSTPEIEVRSSIDFMLRNLRKVIDRVDPEGRTTYGDGNEITASIYEKENITFSIVRLLWSIRRTLKLIIAYGDYPETSVLYSPAKSIERLENIFENLAELFDTKLEYLHLMAILMNCVIEPNQIDIDNVNSSDNLRIIFENEMEMEENISVWSECSSGLVDWIEKNILEQQNILASTKLVSILSPLSESI